MASAIVWDFEPRTVAFSLSLRASFQPSVGGLSVSFPWLDDKSASLTKTETLGPLNTFERSAAKGTGRPGALEVQMQKPLGSLPVSLDLVRCLQTAILPVSIQLPSTPGGNGPKIASGAARLHLGPLLLAGGGVEGALDATSSALSATKRSPHACEVGATWTETIGVAGLYSLELRISTDMPLLSANMMERLMPVCFTVDTVRGLPNESSLPDACQDMYVKIRPKLSSASACLADECRAVSSASLPHNSAARFAEPVVWLLGAVGNMHAVREWMQHEGLIVEVHDRDPKVPAIDSQEEGGAGDGEQRPEPVHAHGVAHFALEPLLVSRKLHATLRADVFPFRSDKKKRNTIDMAQGLQADGLLHEEGREQLARSAARDKKEFTTNYHSSGTFCTIAVALAKPIPKAKHLQDADESRCKDHWNAEEKRHDETSGNIFVASSASNAVAPKVAPRAQPCRAKVTLSTGEELVGPWRQKRDLAETDEQRLLAADAESGTAHDLHRKLHEELPVGLDCRHEKYGRAVVLVNEYDTATIQAILDIVRSRNAGLLGLDPDSSEMRRYEFTDAQKDDPHLDALTGFSVLDGRSRLMIIEGLREHGLKDLMSEMPRNNRLNTVHFKVLYNPLVGFSERLYMKFGPTLKQVKLRMYLEKLCARSELYSNTGTMSEDTMAGMEAPKLLMELKHTSRLHVLREGVSFPKASHIENLEIYYGDYCTDEELAGLPAPRSPGTRTKAGVVRAAGLLVANTIRGTSPHQRDTSPDKASYLQQAVDNTGSTMCPDSASRGKKVSRKQPLDMTNAGFDSTLTMRKTGSANDFHRTNKEMVKSRSVANAKLNDIMGKKKVRQTPFLDGQEVHNYSTMRHNCTEKQKAWMRQHMSRDETKKAWTFNSTYNTTEFPMVPEAKPKNSHDGERPNDTYANIPGDNRPVWRTVHAREKESFRKPARDLGPAREAELHESFSENCLHTLAFDSNERRSALGVTKRYDPYRVPHHRWTTDRPFGTQQIQLNGEDFGPLAFHDSVHFPGSWVPEGPKMHARTSDSHLTEAKRFIDSLPRLTREKFPKTLAASQGLFDSNTASLDCHTGLPGRFRGTVGQLGSIPPVTVHDRQAVSMARSYGNMPHTPRKCRPVDFLTQSSPILKQHVEDEKLPSRAPCQLVPFAH